MDKAKEQVLSKMYPEVSSVLSKCDFNYLNEIRFRSGRPLMLYYSHGVYFVKKDGSISKNERDSYRCTPSIISKLVSSFCAQSVYAYQNEIKEGFITISGGHRVGISGRAVNEDGIVKSITDLSGVNIRIAREYINCADKCMDYILENERIYNTVIVSPAGVGKTTYLRDIARQLSKTHKVSIVDERSEIAAADNGIPQFDVGNQTDVLDGFSKCNGLVTALRALSPDVLITDEVGTSSDEKAIRNILCGGCKIVTSMHGYEVDEMIEKNNSLLRLFERVILLKRVNGVPEMIECLKL